MQDEQIVALYWERDESAITATQEKYAAYLTKIAHNILDDPGDSEESVNDTYLAAWNSIPPQRPSVLSTYLGKLTRRISIDRWRRRTSQKRGKGEFALSMTEMEDLMTDREDPQSVLDAKVLGELLNRFLRTLKPEERNAFIGRYYYMDTLRDVASYCGMSEGKAKSMLFRTRQHLRTYLEEEGYIL
ncbi:MAG: sigma-70 family RNA polymerase sigma factor [Ruminococcaceae bacterium]|nr:sigma-70 family RNA polymerase sigma factor [Oscillospiraceae bacterium]